jgi:hypothetical protein
MTDNKLIQTFFLFVVKWSEAALGEGPATYILCSALIAISMGFIRNSLALNQALNLLKVMMVHSLSQLFLTNVTIPQQELVA